MAASAVVKSVSTCIDHLHVRHYDYPKGKDHLIDESPYLVDSNVRCTNWSNGSILYGFTHIHPNFKEFLDWTNIVEAKKSGLSISEISTQLTHMLNRIEICRSYMEGFTEDLSLKNVKSEVVKFFEMPHNLDLVDIERLSEELPEGLKDKVREFFKRHIQADSELLVLVNSYKAALFAKRVK